MNVLCRPLKDGEISVEGSGALLISGGFFMLSTDVYSNISQRAAAAFRRMLCPAQAGDSAIHSFFAAFYDSLFAHPEAFGLPVGPDLSIAEDEPNEKERKQEVQQKIKKAHDQIQQGLEFLRLAGLHGELAGQALVLADLDQLRRESGVSKKFLAGLPLAGGVLQSAGGRTLLSCPAQPAAPGGLQCLARACENIEDARRCLFHFARCDMRAANPRYEPDVLELYQAFDPADAALAARLHDFFSGRGYKTTLEAGGPFAWVVKYQGDRKMKASAFFQIQFEDRYAHPMRLDLKCASTNRLAPLLPSQPQTLQDDFARRVFNCNGDKCNWCRNQKSLGPSVLVHNGQERVVCWFSNSSLRHPDESTLELVRQYTDLHDQLLNDN